MASAADVDVLLLAAGRSNRFGTDDKLLAALDGRPLVLHAAATLAKLGARRLIAVCSSDAVAALLGEAGYTVIRNDDPDAGMGRSTALGAALLPDEGRTLVALADMPRVATGHLVSILSTEAPVVASTDAGVRSPPALFDASCKPQLRALSGDRGARDLLARAVTIPAPPGSLADVDTPAMLSRLRAPSA